jgi:hypothetical protein
VVGYHHFRGSFCPATHSYIWANFLVPWTSSSRWRQQVHLKHWYPATAVHGVTTQKTSTWMYKQSWFKTSRDIQTHTHILNLKCYLKCRGNLKWI